MTSYSRFTDRARRCLHDAAKIAADRGDGYVGTEHLLLAVLRAGGWGERLAAHAAGLDYMIADSMLRQMSPQRTPDPYALIAAGLAGRPENTVVVNVAVDWSKIPLFGTGGTYTAS